MNKNKQDQVSIESFYFKNLFCDVGLCNKWLGDGSHLLFYFHLLPWALKREKVALLARNESAAGAEFEFAVCL